MTFVVKKIASVKNSFLVIALLFFSVTGFSQKVDSIKPISNLSGAITVTNNGISLFPNFTLGKPAAIFDLSMAKGRLSFEPQLRFALEGKPWSFLFWWRYKLVKTNHFTMNVAAHPAFVFKTISVLNNGITKEYITTQRYIAAETTPTYLLNKHISVGVHYLYSHGFEKDAIQNSNFVAVRAAFANMKLSKGIALTMIPQCYYLKMDSKSGVYVSTTTMLKKNNFPFSLSSIVSKAINTDIAGKDFVWNLSLVYSFSKKYIRQ